MIPITTAQLKAVHAMISRLGIVDQKADLVAQFTNGRTQSSKEMSMQEARALLERLGEIPVVREGTSHGGTNHGGTNHGGESQRPPRQAPRGDIAKNDGVRRMRGKLKQMGREMGWSLEALNEWCRKYSYLKKGMYEYKEAELPRLVSQVEYGPYKYYLSKG